MKLFTTLDSTNKRVRVLELKFYKIRSQMTKMKSEADGNCRSL